jgi:hypothetical protein
LEKPAGSNPTSPIFKVNARVNVGVNVRVRGNLGINVRVYVWTLSENPVGSKLSSPTLKNKSC